MTERSVRKEPLQPVRIIPVSLEGIRRSQENEKKVKPGEYTEHQLKVFKENKYFHIALGIFNVRGLEEELHKINVYMNGHYFYYSAVNGEAEVRGVQLPQIDHKVVDTFALRAIPDEKAREDYREAMKVMETPNAQADPNAFKAFRERSMNYFPVLDDEFTRRLFLFPQIEPHFYEESIKKFRPRMTPKEFKIFTMAIIDGHYLFEAYYDKQQQDKADKAE